MNALRSFSLAIPPRFDCSDFLLTGKCKRGRLYLARIAALVAAFTLCAAGASAATLTVNTTADSTDASGSCTSGTCSLRDAITQAGAGDTINFSVNGSIALTSALPAITQNATIQGPGANQLSVSGAGFAVFQVGPTANVVISGLTITGGVGAISVNASAAVTVQNCVFTANTGTTGGVIDNAGTLTVSSSTFNGNSAQQGGALFNASGGTATVADSTFTQNSASAGGGAIQNVGTLTATNNTFYANSAAGGSGGAIFNASSASGALTAGNNVFENNTASTSGAGIFNSSGDTANASFNVYYNNLARGSEDDCNHCSTNANATSAAANPLVLPLGGYGGPTQTFLPLPGSAAICKGSLSVATTAGLTADQRGFALNPGYTVCTAGLVDAGAVQTNYIEVPNSGDAGAGASDCPGSSCTLRDAIALAGSAGDIDFIPGVTTVNLVNTNGGLTLNAAAGIEIVGPGANSLTIKGNGNSTNPLSVFTVNSGTQAMLYGLTVTGGNSTADGGGVNNSGTLLLAESSVATNVAGGNGGGVSNGGALTVLDSTISGNSAVGKGGGIYNSGGGAMASVTESTIAGNSAGASGDGGGVYNTDSMVITGSTIWGNSDSSVAGGIVSSGTLTLANSIVANNSSSTGSANRSGTFTDGGGNVIGGSNSTNTANAGGTGAVITMSSLQLNGAKDTVPTLMPLPGGSSGNPVICAGKASNISSGITTDERGYPVKNTTYTGYSSASPCVDAGAVQTNYTMSFTTNPPATLTVDQGLGAEVTLNENGAPFAGANVPIPVTISAGSSTLYGSGVVSGTGSVSTSAGVANFSSLTASVGSGDVLTSTLSLNASLTTPLSLTASSTSSFDVNPATTSLALISDNISPPVNGAVTFTATVSAPAGSTVPLTGNVTFTDNGTVITKSSNCGNKTGVIAVNATGMAECTTSALTGGSHSIVATYNKDNSDPNYLSSNNNVTESVGLVATTMTTPTVPPGSLTVNQPVTVTATVAPTAGGTPTVNFSGSMEFLNNGVAISNCAAVTVTANSTGATASCQISGLAASSTPYSITAQYKGDSSYAQSGVSAPLSLTVTKANVNISLNSSSPGNTSTVNQSVTFTATVTENPTGSVNLAGTVTFTDNGATIATCSAVTPSLSTGVATCLDTALDAQHSPHSIQANYSGDPNFANNTQSLSQTVNPASTSTTVTSSVNPSVLNQPLTFTALVTPAPGSVGLSSSAGTVNFKDSATGTSIVGCSAQPITINNGVGQATCPTSALAVDSGATPHTITAIYGSDPNFTTSSGTVSQTVNPVSSSILLSSTGVPMVNQTVTFTATIGVSTTQPALVGTVAFTDSALPGSGIIPACATQAVTQLNSSTWTATCQDTSLTAGSHTITAHYSADPNLSVGNGTWTQVMNQAQSSVIISGGTGTVYVQNPNGLNDSVTFTATVTENPTGIIPLSGAVTFNGVPSCQGASASTPATLPVSPASGQATCTTTSLPAGPNAISASYSGDVNFANASSNQLVQPVSDYSITMVNVPTGASGVQVTQGFTTTAGSSGATVDPFAPAHPVAVSPTSIGSYSSSGVTITCASSASGAPVCLPGDSSSASLQIAAGSVVQQTINVTIDASGASVAPGTYTFTVTAKDNVTGLTRTTTFPVSIRPGLQGKTALNVVSGATTNNSATVSFLLPQGVTLTNPACVAVVGTNVTTAAAPGTVGVGCTASPTSLGSSTSTGPQTVTATVTVTTNNTIAALKPMDVGNRRPLLLVAGFMLPLFGLLGIGRGRKSIGATFFRMIAIVAIGIAAFQTLGCGGSYHSSTPGISGGTTPPGTYYLLVQGSGSDGKNYQAVLQVNVNL